MDLLHTIEPGETILDISYNQQEPDLLAAKNAGVRGVMIRATDGAVQNGKMIVDPKFYRNVKVAEDIGLPWGAYHRFKPGTKYVAQAVQQAQHFLSVVFQPDMPYQGPSLPLALDWERFEAWGEPMLHPYDAITFLNIIEIASGNNPLFYTSANFLDGHTTKVAHLGLNHEWALDFRLWVAHYTARPEPFMPAAWRSSKRPYAIWQYKGNEGRWTGFKTAVDINRRGTG